MAKKTPQKKPVTSRFVLPLFCAAFAGTCFWAWNNERAAEWKEQFFRYINNEELATLEARHLPEKILSMHRQEFLGNEKKTLQETRVKYYPYLLLDIKYTGEDKKSKEGFLLWGMEDGEIILNTSSWEKTHGFRDCLDCHANKNDFKILQFLAKREGESSIEELQKELQVDRDLLQAWIQQTKDKHLVIQTGNKLRLHFEQPKLVAVPQTKIHQQIVSKPQNEGIKVPRQYSRQEILHMAKEAFGRDLKIRSEREIFLPVYALEILNPDGSVQISEWNSLTGQKIIPRYLQ